MVNGDRGRVHVWTGCSLSPKMQIEIFNFICFISNNLHASFLVFASTTASSSTSSSLLIFVPLKSGRMNGEKQTNREHRPSKTGNKAEKKGTAKVKPDKGKNPKVRLPLLRSQVGSALRNHVVEIITFFKLFISKISPRAKFDGRKAQTAPC
jgi:hypothetical protein